MSYLKDVLDEVNPEGPLPVGHRLPHLIRHLLLQVGLGGAHLIVVGR